uniref:Ubiquitin-like domain-containing protein n=1 Tax=Triticum urartu TaxID=4572 RepID=A0A8R7URT8_TRIUA
MKLTVMTADEQFLNLDVDPDESVENLKALLEVETQVPLQQQLLHFNGKEMNNAEKLSAIGVHDGDLVMMVASNNRTSQDIMRLNPDGSAVNPQAFQQHIRGDSQLMAQLLQNDPSLAQAILGDDITELQNILRSHHQQRLQLKHKQEEELALLYADPFDVEAQKKIEAAIRQKGIDENWEAAIEHNPEAFGRVVMLYVDMEVNGVPLKAFVDSGAQSTIISKDCAERCGYDYKLKCCYCNCLVFHISYDHSACRSHTYLRVYLIIQWNFTVHVNVNHSVGTFAEMHSMPYTTDHIIEYHLQVTQAP